MLILCMTYRLSLVTTLIRSIYEEGKPKPKVIEFCTEISVICVLANTLGFVSCEVATR